MNQAEELGEISPEQYDSRKTKAAGVQDLNTRLFYNLVRYEKVTTKSVFADLIYDY